MTELVPHLLIVHVAMDEYYLLLNETRFRIHSIPIFIFIDINTEEGSSKSCFKNTRLFTLPPSYIRKIT